MVLLISIDEAFLCRLKGHAVAVFSTEHSILTSADP